MSPNQRLVSTIAPGDGPFEKVTLVLSSPEEARQLITEGLISHRAFTFQFDFRVSPERQKAIWAALIFAARSRRSASVLSDLILQVPEDLRSMAMLAFEDLHNDLNRITWWDKLCASLASKMRKPLKFMKSWWGPRQPSPAIAGDFSKSESSG